MCFTFFFVSFSIQLQSFLQISVSQVRIDECPSSECAGSGGCTSVLNVRDTPTVVDCGTMSLVSVTVESTAVCSCTGREQSHQPCAAYPRNPCFNGGVCVDTQHGYRWVENDPYPPTVVIITRFLIPFFCELAEPVFSSWDNHLGHIVLFILPYSLQELRDVTKIKLLKCE